MPLDCRDLAQQKAKVYDRPEATANAAIASRLPYVMVSSRFAHYLKVMARDLMGAFMAAEDCEKLLNRWINNYVISEDSPSLGPGDIAKKSALCCWPVRCG